MNTLLEIARWGAVIAGFALASQYDAPADQIYILCVFLVIGIAGLTAIEGLVFAEEAASKSGYTRSPYQQQSALNNLALAIVAAASFALSWGTAADLALLSTLLVFLLLSAINHLVAGINTESRSWRTYTRPLASLALTAISLPYVLAAAPSP